jgi:hypothetical protein
MGTFDDFFQTDGTKGYSAFFATPGVTPQQGYEAILLGDATAGQRPGCTT